MSRSASYQHVYVEIPIKTSQLNNYDNTYSLSSYLDTNWIDPQIKEYQLLLWIEVKKIIETTFTEQQKRVMKLHLLGTTQDVIAKKYNISQGAVHKCLYGNADYSRRNRGRPKHYGGCIKKLIKFCSKNKEIQDILLKIEQVKINRVL